MDLVSDATVRHVVDEYVDDLMRERERYERGEYDSLEEVILPARPKSFIVGTLMLRVGDCERGREWVGFGAAGLLDRTTRYDPEDAYDPDHARIRVPVWVRKEFDRALHGAVLSRDAELATETGERALERLAALKLADRDDPAARLLTAHAAALAGDEHRATERLAAGVDDPDRPYGKVKHGLRMLEGILDEDPDEVEAGGEGHVAKHAEEVRGDAHGTSRAAVDYRAAGSLALARSRGLDVRVDSEFVPDCVYEPY